MSTREAEGACTWILMARVLWIDAVAGGSFRDRVGLSIRIAVGVCVGHVCWWRYNVMVVMNLRTKLGDWIASIVMD